MVFGDCAVNVSPSAQDLALIASSSADTAAAFGISPPLVAMLSYSTGMSLDRGPAAHLCQEMRQRICKFGAVGRVNEMMLTAEEAGLPSCVDWRGKSESMKLELCYAM